MSHYVGVRAAYRRLTVYRPLDGANVGISSIEARFHKHRLLVVRSSKTRGYNFQFHQLDGPRTAPHGLVSTEQFALGDAIRTPLLQFVRHKPSCLD